MGKKDAVSKHYMSKNEIFADAVNFYFFDGREKVKPEELEELEELDSSELVLPYGKSTEQKSTKGDSVQGKSILSTPVQKYRDILKRCVIRRCQETVYMIYGIEAQSDIHYAMPVRSMLYDALHCASQVSEIAREHREKGTYGSSGEFLSGFHKSDRLWPVQTLVVYFGSMRWDGPRSLREMLVLPESMKRSFLNDYRLNLLVPGEIEDFSKFHTELGAVLEVLKVMEDREAMAELMCEKSNVYERLPRDAAELLRIFAKIDMEIEEDEEEINMCRAIDEMMAEAREEGRESLMTNMMRNFSRSGVSFEEVSSFISEEDFSGDQLRDLWEKACGKRF